jgi:Zinc carboxypeptidase
MKNTFLILLLIIFTSALYGSELLTRAEKTHFQETSRYAEMADFCKALDEASPWIKFTSFGKTPQGRDLPLLIISKTQNFTAEAVRKSDGIVLLIINGIHAGEIAGKEASLMLARDLAIAKKNPELLDHVTLLIVPIYNVDGHERFGPYNRINQNGPKEMGWRTTSQNLNLNRDWVKSDQPETIAMLKVFNEWLPEMLIDNHVTDGADYQYDMYYLTDSPEAMSPEVRSYIKGTFEPKLLTRLTSLGHVASIYLDLVDPMNPGAGMQRGPTTPRFSNGYATLQNRPLLLAESHMLKSFENRIKAHYDLMSVTLKNLNEDFRTLHDAVLKDDEDAKNLGKQYDPNKKFVLSLKLNDKKSTPIRFKGVEYRITDSSVSGGKQIEYGKKPYEFEVPLFQTLDPDAFVAPPLGYIIPPQWEFVEERLKNHDIKFERLKKPSNGRFETYRFTDVSWKPAPFEGRHEVIFKTVPVIEERTLPAESMVVWLNQRSNKVILHLLEPDGPDSLLRWGFFNAIFEQKEYAESYVLEKLAREMLQKDPKLKKEFEDRLKNDPKFAADPQSRLQFFYERSPYWDLQENAYPIVRITDRNQIATGLAAQPGDHKGRPYMH